MLPYEGPAIPAPPTIFVKGRVRAFRKGETVVHPEHGAALIEEVREKEFLGEKRKYLVLRVVYGDLTVLVPTDSTDAVGLRPVVSKNEVKKVLKVLTEDETSVAANWSRRFKNNLEKLHSGDPYEVAEVLRNLAIRDREKGLSAGEKRMIHEGPADPDLRARARHQQVRRGRRGDDRRRPRRRPRRQGSGAEACSRRLRLRSRTAFR